MDTDLSGQSKRAKKRTDISPTLKETQRELGTQHKLDSFIDELLVNGTSGHMVFAHVSTGERVKSESYLVK